MITFYPSCDILAIRSGSFARRLSGDLGSFSFRSMTAKDHDTLIVIEFTSDGSVTKRGFKAYYRISPAPTTPTATISTTTSPTTSPPILGKINYLLIRIVSTGGKTSGKTTGLLFRGPLFMSFTLMTYSQIINFYILRLVSWIKMPL